MIKKSTVLVLGAGASKPYGFPTGGELREILCDANTAPWMSICDLVNQVRGGGRFEAFVDKFRKSGWQSVDAFLEHRTEWLPVGKLAIAGALLPYEQPHELTRKLTEGGRWYSYLLEQLRCKPEEWSSNKLTVITYNYDRSLEFFLVQAIGSAFRLDPPEARALAATTPILHLHGQLGDLATRDLGGNPYDGVLDYTSIQLAADKIRIISEVDKASDIFTPARAALLQADRIYYLGFGYAVDNMNRLAVGLPPFQGHRAGTACGLGDGEKHEVSDYFGGAIDLGGSDEPILPFLKRMPQLRKL